MNRRAQRVASLIRDTIGQLLLAKIADPRIDPARTSITHVDVPEDLLTARVFISVIGSEAQQRNALRALNHAAGHIQELMMRQISLRNTPLLEFVEDKSFKKSLETYAAIQQAMEEIRQKEEARQAESASESTPTDQAQNPDQGKQAPGGESQESDQ